MWLTVQPWLDGCLVLHEIFILAASLHRPAMAGRLVVGTVNSEPCCERLAFLLELLFWPVNEVDFFRGSS